ncbi:hypothetical protein LCGC14_1826770 [marine sediment metagenome]|uniref:Uncharacterized protein n=1 Tax=marine sediment metagenome TaxID=412755 RepID=A0A0F9GHI9_9ZZZZ
MKKYGLLVVSTFLVHSAGTWAYTFFIILRRGSIRLGESIRPIMKKYGLLVVSTFLVHNALLASYVFFIIIQKGNINLGEPNRFILIAEFWMAVVWMLVGVFFMVVATLALLKRTRAAKVNG